jgi:two-component system OmpR family sensor kinase
LFNKYSIFFILKIGFLLCIIVLLFIFSTLIKEEGQRFKSDLKKRYGSISNVIVQEYQRFGLTQNLEDIINDMHLTLVKDEEEIDTLLDTSRLKFLFKQRAQNSLIVAFVSKEKNYIHIQTPFDEFLIVDTNHPPETIKRFIFLLLVILLALMVVYFVLQKRLKPLKELKQKIIQEKHTEETDEVSLIAQEFEHSSNSLKKIKEARNVFIRNIMHELKTPIMKGKFLIELPQDAHNKESMKKVFYRLESLINEFVSIEEIISKDEAILKKEYFFDDILDNAINLLMCDDNQHIQSDIKNTKLLVHFKLFCIVVKNLIDNAFKYGQTKQVIITQKDNAILFINDGKPLKKELSYYLTPFNEQKNANSFGLGLYIIQNILNAHDFNLEYEYKEEKNIFKIIL